MAAMRYYIYMYHSLYFFAYVCPSIYLSPCCALGHLPDRLKGSEPVWVETSAGVCLTVQTEI